MQKPVLNRNVLHAGGDNQIRKFRVPKFVCFLESFFVFHFCQIPCGHPWFDFRCSSLQKNHLTTIFLVELLFQCLQFCKIHFLIVYFLFFIYSLNMHRLLHMKKQVVDIIDMK